MLGQLLIMLREGLEAALIISIMLAYLTRTRRHRLSRYVWYGVSLAVVLSLALGASIWLFHGSLPDMAQALFEGLTALLAAAILSTMIYWMVTRGSKIEAEMERRVESFTTQKAIFGLASLSFTVVFREGLESVLFLMPFLVNEFMTTLIGSLVGISMAIMMAYMIFVIGMKINLRSFFYFTSILLIFLAGGLTGYGTHELIEYAEKVGIGLNWLSVNAYVLPIPPDNPLHHKNILGSILAVLFGYTVKAEWARVIVQLAYLTVALPYILMMYQRD